MENVKSFNEFSNMEPVASSNEETIVNSNEVNSSEETNESFDFDVDFDSLDEAFFDDTRMFFTGRTTTKTEAEKTFMDALTDAEKICKADPNTYPQAKKWEATQAFLYGRAVENKFKGGLKPVQSAKTGKVLYIYQDGISGIEALGAAAKGGERKIMNG